MSQLPELVEIARRWAGRLSDTSDGTGEGLEAALLELAREAYGAADAEPHAATERFATLYAAAPTGVALADASATIVEANPALAELLDVPAERLRGRALLDLAVHERDGRLLAERLADLDGAAPGTRSSAELVELARSGGEACWAHVSFSLLPSDVPGTSYPVAFVSDAEELRGLREAFERQSVSDPLTNLSNASRFRSHLESTLGVRPAGQIALVYFDIDGFKVVADGIGSQGSDEILRSVARRLSAVFDSADDAVAPVASNVLLGRVAGDGFGVMLRGQFSTAVIVGLVERALRELAEPVYTDNLGVAVSASAGIAVREAHAAEPEQLVEGARLALHRAKQAGKAQWALYDPRADPDSQTRYRIGAGIGGGLENGEFTVACRPCVELPDQETVVATHLELFWEHPEHGLLPPRQFSALADTTGMTPSLGRHLLDSAAATAASWRGRYGADAPVPGVFLPARLAVDGELVGMVGAALWRHALPGAALRLAADAGAFRDTRGDFAESARLLAEQGTSFVIGISGPADVELVRRSPIPVAAVTLTGEPVAELAGDDPPESARRWVGRLVRHAGELGLPIGASGVVSGAHATRLYELGVGVVTGPYLAATSDRERLDSWFQGVAVPDA